MTVRELDCTFPTELRVLSVLYIATRWSLSHLFVFQCWRRIFFIHWWSWTDTYWRLFLMSWTRTRISRSLRAATWMVTPSPWQTATCFPNSTLSRWAEFRILVSAHYGSGLPVLSQRWRGVRCCCSGVSLPIKRSQYPSSPQVVCKKYRDFAIPPQLKGLTRYLDNAYQQDEFRYTCPQDLEVLYAYECVAKYLNKQSRRWSSKATNRLKTVATMIVFGQNNTCLSG